MSAPVLRGVAGAPVTVFDAHQELEVATTAEHAAASLRPDCCAAVP